MVANTVYEQQVVDAMARLGATDEYKGIVTVRTKIVSGRAYVYLEVDGDLHKTEQNRMDFRTRLVMAVQGLFPGNDHIRDICTDRILTVRAESVTEMLNRAVQWRTKERRAA